VEGTKKTPPSPAVVVDGVSKVFNVPREKSHTLKERALHPFRRSEVDRFPALNDVSFAVEPGEFFGIVGRNGSGKSTLLKCMAGIYAHDTGEVYVNGRLSTFIELGVGFNPDLAARDNVTLNGVMLGLPPRDARSRFERVIEFAELEEFVDLKLKNYSSGMQVRLAFSVMLEVEADVMLIDEVLAVGDMAFQQKCFDQFYRIRDEGRTIILVTHDMATVERYCHRALLLERGDLITIGEPHEVTAKYVELNFPQQRQDAPGDEARYGDGQASILDAWMEDRHGRRTRTLGQGEPCVFRMHVRFHQEVLDPIFGVAFEDDQHHPIFATNTLVGGEVTGRFAPDERAEFVVEFENAFRPGRYFANAAVAHRGGGAAWIDRRERMVSMVVTGTKDAGSLVFLPHDLRLERTPVAGAREVST
jgi:ABC-type polysaccharide/polyol phosphate transport system ATPase subunit